MWHLAAAATGPDEEVATALEQAGAKIQARAGLAASAAFLRQSMMLTAEPGRHTERALAAALAHLHAGAFDTALGLLARAEAHAVDDLQRARVEQLRGQVEWHRSPDARRPCCCCGQPGGSNHSIRGSPGRPTCTPGWRPISLVLSPGPAGSCRKFPWRHKRPRGQPGLCGLVISSLSA
ncbi:MAG: hypothetical protein ACRDPF_36015 [Streptosporangiaceae bacterium]